MRKPVLAAAAALMLAGSASLASAQQAPSGSPNGGSGSSMQTPAPGPGGWMHRRHEWRHHRPFMPGTFSLFFNRGDRQLGPGDVVEIAQAILLWNGNHTWKVVDVAPGPDDTVLFAYATPDGTVIARFAMNSHTGRLFRIG